jgi:hypothetical protein
MGYPSARVSTLSGQDDYPSMEGFAIPLGPGRGFKPFGTR